MRIIAEIDTILAPSTNLVIDLEPAKTGLRYSHGISSYYVVLTNSMGICNT